MPIEIRELVIRATVSNAGAGGGGGQQAAPAASTDEAKVQQIVDAIMKKIKNKNER